MNIDIRDNSDDEEAKAELSRCVGLEVEGIRDVFKGHVTEGHHQQRKSDQAADRRRPFFFPVARGFDARDEGTVLQGVEQGDHDKQLRLAEQGHVPSQERQHRYQEIQARCLF